MPIDLEKLSADQLKTLIKNHRDQHATDTQLYVDALRLYEIRARKGLEFDKSLIIIKAAAEREEFLSYKELAEASGVEWNLVRYEMNTHLGNLVEYSHRKGWPMISAIVVNQAHKATGGMEPSTLTGFVEAARNLGISVASDHTEFLRQQQRKVFDCAKSGWEIAPLSSAPR